MMQALPTVKLGAAGEAVRTVQGACCARSDVVPGAVVVVDGTFGVKTLAAVKAVQGHYLGAASADGIVGPETWPVLLGI
jgi:peptidoglycan hydrolase-like protein with peptidoglycan-binding domain